MNNIDNSDNYYKLEKIGIGGGGNPVYIVKSLTNLKKFALKKIVVNKDSPEEMQRVINEIKILKQLDHPYLIKYEDSFIHKNKIWIIMEYAEEKDLERKIKYYKSKKEKIEENDVWKYFLQIISAILYLHQNKIIHRDIKGQNILLSKGNVKLGDFGTSKKMDNTNAFANTSLGTPFFLSPEICKGEPYTFKNDNWMIGCVLFELMTLELPFKGNNLPILMKNIINNPTPEINTNYNEELKFLCRNLLKKDMKERISIYEIINRPIVKEKIKAFNIYFNYNNNINISFNNNYFNCINSNCNNNVYGHLNNNKQKEIYLKTETIVEPNIKEENKVYPIDLIKQNNNNKNINPNNNITKNTYISNIKEDFKQNKIVMKKKISEILINNSNSNSDSLTEALTPTNINSPIEHNKGPQYVNHTKSSNYLTKNINLKFYEKNHKKRDNSQNHTPANVNCNYSLSPNKKRTQVYLYEFSYEKNKKCDDDCKVSKEE